MRESPRFALRLAGSSKFPHAIADLVAHVERHCETIAVIPHVARSFFRGGQHSPKLVRYPPCYLVLHRHISAIPHFATYLETIVRYPIKPSTKEFCDTIATSIARSGKYRCWASKTAEQLCKTAPKWPMIAEIVVRCSLPMPLVLGER